jgi:glycosyltransferase involved in cell wall biosynthesis
VQAFATFEAATQSGGELVLAGSLESCPTYSTLVRALARETGANIRFTGHLADASPVYAGAHLFLSMSEHEGFCMPVAEAMAAGVPVLAYAAAAVPDTVGNGGILFSRKSIPDVAELVAALVGDSARLSALREAGMTRVRDFAHDRLAGALAGILADCGFRP